ncbi:MAG: FtsX-like permease family protein [Lachnospiraceae bacterium]|nr:FtsX-like permease family protein [Lachnospiraceae bacterium]
MGNYKIVHKVTKEYMMRNKKRTITTLLGIVFMVMLMTCVFVGKDTAIRYLEELATLERGSWHINVYDVTDDEYKQISNLDDVEQIGVSVNLDYAMFAQTANVNRPYIQIKSYSEGAFELHKINVVEGRLPQTENEIVLNREAVEDGADIHIGDIIEARTFKRYIGKAIDQETTTMFAGGFQVAPGQCLEAPAGFPYYGENDDFYEKIEYSGAANTYEIVGFIEKPSFEKRDAAGYTALTYNDGVQISGSEKNISIRFDLKRNGDYDTAVEKIVGADCEMEYNSMLLAFSANSKDSTINGIVIFMSVFFVVLIVAASVVLIYNVFNMSFEERTKYLGMLSSVGATGKQKRSSVYYEAFSLLVVGLPAGFVMGLLVVKIGMMALKPHLDTLLGMYASTSIDRVSLEISLVGVAFIVVLSGVTVWISAYLPARKIGKIGPIECIRGNVGRGAKKRSVNKLAMGLFGAEGLLAVNSISREKKKTRGLIGAVTMFMIVLIITTYSSKALTTIVNYAMSEDGTINVKMESDFMATVYMNDLAQPDYKELKERVLNDESVESCVEYYNGMFLGRGDSSILSQEYLDACTGVMDAYGVSTEEQNEYIKNLQPHVNFIGFDDVMLEKIVELTGADKSIMYNENVKPVIIMQTGEVSTKNMRFTGSKEADFKFYEIEQMSKVGVGETFEVSILNGATQGHESVPVVVAGYATNNQLQEYFTFHSDMLWLITDCETVQELVDVELVGEGADLHNYSKNLYIKFHDKSSQLYSDLNSMHLETMGSDVWEGLIVLSSSLFDMETITSAINAVIEILLKCFVALTSVICLLNLYNSTKGRITGRRKELAILRSMGMTERQMRKMLLLEGGCVLMRSVMIAIIVTTPVLIMIEKVLVELFGQINLGAPVGVYLVAATTAAIALMAVIISAHNREKSANILEDIRKESI